MSADAISEMGEIEGEVDGFFGGEYYETKSSVLIGKNSV